MNPDYRLYAREIVTNTSFGPRVRTEFVLETAPESQKKPNSLKGRTLEELAQSAALFSGFGSMEDGAVLTTLPASRVRYSGYRHPAQEMTVEMPVSPEQLVQFLKEYRTNRLLHNMPLGVRFEDKFKDPLPRKSSENLIDLMEAVVFPSRPLPENLLHKDKFRGMDYPIIEKLKGKY